MLDQNTQINTMTAVDLVQTAEQAVLYGEIGLAKKAFVSIRQEKDSPIWNTLTLQEKSRLEELYQKLHLILIPTLSDVAFEDTLVKYLGLGAELEDFDLVEKVGYRIAFTESAEDQAFLVEKIKADLERSQSTLGDRNKFLTDSFKPTVANWIKEYMATPTKNPHRGNLEEIEFLNHDLKAVKLSQKEKTYLLGIIKLFDSLVVRISVLHAPITAAENSDWSEKSFYEQFPALSEEISKLGFQPAETRKTDSVQPGMAIQSPAVPKKPEIRPLPVMPSRPIQNIVSKPVPPPVRPVEKPVMPVRPPQIQEPAVQTLSDIQAEIENKKLKAQEEIDKKLEELKRKVQR